MTKEEFSDAKRLYKFRDCLRFIPRDKQGVRTSHYRRNLVDSPEYYAIAAGIVTLYGRPFTDNKRIGK
jgi:hypothetical protein